MAVDEQIRLAVGAHRARCDDHPVFGQEVDAFAERGRLQLAGIGVIEMLTAAGRKLKAKPQKVPGCILSASQCSIPELVQLTTQIRDLRERLAGKPTFFPLPQFASI